MMEKNKTWNTKCKLANQRLTRNLTNAIFYKKLLVPVIRFGSDGIATVCMSSAYSDTSVVLLISPASKGVKIGQRTNIKARNPFIGIEFFNKESISSLIGYLEKLKNNIK